MIPLLLAAAVEVSVAKPLAVYSLSAGLDLASTEYALARGYGEGNPLMRDRGARVALTLASTALLTRADVNLQKKGRKGAARALRVTVFVVRFGLAAHNMLKVTR